ncbi:MAG: amino acid permease [Rickettsiaceae bacterium]|nr:amino acid permease [Rickettsiaceae bacterium]MDP5020825.1 amino acid permease [Rickettsiaceae bacterium]MDP5083355.1 amino acid permease [Rickettsiaceae bacterium]
MSFFKKKSFQSVKDTYSTSGLDKNLTAFDLVLLGLGGIVGTGVFALTGLVAAQYAGPAITISYAIAGFVCIFVALAYTELATMLPTSGSIYTYSYVAFGEVFAWLVGSVIIMELGFAASAVAGSWSAYVQGILTSAGYGLPEYLVKTPFEGGIINLPALLVVLLVGFMLYRGTKESKRLNNMLVFVKMSAIFIFIFFAAPHFDSTNWENFMPYGFDDVLHGSSILFFAYTGFGTLASAAEECKNPKRDLTIGIIGSLVCATAVYVLVAAVLTGVVPFSELDNAQPLAYALQLTGSNIGSALVATGAVAGMTTVIMINAYGQSRIFYVIARDGLLPKALAKIHHKYDSPHFTILFFTMLIGLMGALIPYSWLAQLSSMGALTDYMIVAVIVMLFRVKYPEIERPFKCPAIFIVAPIALLASLYLLFKQIISKHGDILMTGKVFIYWFIIIFILYVIKIYWFKDKKSLENNS